MLNVAVLMGRVVADPELKHTPNDIAVTRFTIAVGRNFGKTAEERKTLLDVIKHFKLTVTGLRGFDEAIITGGGIAVKEINPQTMELKRIKNLRLAGEVIDCDALTGGFNLQIAWSTAFMAAQ